MATYSPIYGRDKFAEVRYFTQVVVDQMSESIYNTSGLSQLPARAVIGFVVAADAIDARLTALGY